MIEALEDDGRRRPYRLTPTGAGALEVQLAAQRRIADVGLARLRTAGVTA